MDPIHPIAPGPPLISPATPPPVAALERITRERDRPSRDAQQQQRRHRAPSEPDRPEHGPEDDGLPHVDVRV
jgi:hypothetical protein